MDKINLIIDDEGYVNSYYYSVLGLFNEDIFTDVEMNYLNAYKLIDNKLILDPEKKNELIIEEEARNKILRINELKVMLSETDYICSRAFEEVLALSNPVTFITDFIKILVKYSTEYKDVIANRVAWRKELEELEK